MKANDIKPGYSYRRVHYTREREQREKIPSGGEFSDPEYPKTQITREELSKLDPNNPRVVLRRLYNLYRQSPKNSKPQFFPENNTPINRVRDHLSLPPFVTEIGIFPIVHYKSLFLTQDFAKDGLYEIIINQNGRYETDVVDDWIPVYEDTLEPIWGMDMDQAWQIILLKFWAKKNQSYLKIKEIPPFQFIEFFTNSNWKYFNLNNEGIPFLAKYTGKTPYGKFVLKTKNTQKVFESGLIPNSAGYELIDLQEITGNADINKMRWVVQIRSTLINKWAGTMSVLDSSINTLYQPNKYKMALERDFMMGHEDFLNLFSAAYVASKRG